MFRFTDQYYSMPAHFGGMNELPATQLYEKCSTLEIRFKTAKEALECYIPESYELLRPEVIVQYMECRGVDWLAGGYYNLINVLAPVKYVGNDEGLLGVYDLVTWENFAEPITGGREKSGVPKVYAEIADFNFAGNTISGVAGFRNRNFLGVQFVRQNEIPAAEIEAMRGKGKQNLFCWRYIPNVGKPGAAVSEAILYPQEAIVKRRWTGSGTLDWTVQTPAQHPTQYHIIGALANLPNEGYVESSFTLSSAILASNQCRALP